jgi:pyruvate,water dikinase
MRWVPLAEAREEAQFGGKAASLGAALRAGLNVPPGCAVDAELAEALAAGASPDRNLLATLGAGPLAVRSSAIGEDSEEASFAGQHLTCLNVIGEAALMEAVRAVWASGRTESALGYRRKLGLPGDPKVAAVLQRMVAADCAGVLFTRNPVTGADERVIEASWGLGEAVVAGLVTPDSWRLRRGGELLEFTLGEKDVEIVGGPSGTVERPVDPARAAAPCLTGPQLQALDRLAEECERFYKGAGDIEWAFAAGILYLLQRRAVTA